MVNHDSLAKLETASGGPLVADLILNRPSGGLAGA